MPIPISKQHYDIKMKNRNFTSIGNVGENGELKISNRAQMVDFLKSWPKSKFTLSLTLYEPNTSAAQLGYYYESILPQFKEAFKQCGDYYTTYQVDQELRRITTSLTDTERVPGVGLIEILVSPEEAGTHRMSEYISELIMLAAKRFSLEIKNPKYD